MSSIVIEQDGRAVIPAEEVQAMGAAPGERLELVRGRQRTYLIRLNAADPPDEAEVRSCRAAARARAERLIAEPHPSGMSVEERREVLRSARGILRGMSAEFEREPDRELP